MADPIITKEQLEARLSAYVVERIFDDANTGTVNEEALNQLLRDASAKVRGHLGPVYDADSLNDDTADELVRITLDVAQAMAAQRHPEVMRIDGFRLLEQAERELKKIRTGLSNLGITGSPEPAANVGGEVYPGIPATTSEPTKAFFRDGTGDF